MEAPCDRAVLAFETEVSTAPTVVINVIMPASLVELTSAG